MPKQEKACASLAKTASTRAVAAGYNQALHVQKAQGVTGPQRFSRHVGASHLVGPSSDETEGGPALRKHNFPGVVGSVVAVRGSPPGAVRTLRGTSETSGDTLHQ